MRDLFFDVEDRRSEQRTGGGYEDEGGREEGGGEKRRRREIPSPTDPPRLRTGGGGEGRLIFSCGGNGGGGVVAHSRRGSLPFSFPPLIPRVRREKRKKAGKGKRGGGERSLPPIKNLIHLLLLLRRRDSLLRSPSLLKRERGREGKAGRGEMASKLGVEEEMEECIGERKEEKEGPGKAHFRRRRRLRPEPTGGGAGGKEEEEHRLPPYSRRTGSAVFPEYGDKQ